MCVFYNIIKYYYIVNDTLAYEDSGAQLIWVLNALFILSWLHSALRYEVSILHPLIL